MACEGSVHCLALAYVADNVSEGRRAPAIGILSGIGSCAFVCGNLSTRFISTASTFQVSTSVAILAAVYMRIFLPESIRNENLYAPILSNCKVEVEESARKVHAFKKLPAFEDMVSLLKSSPTFSQAAVVAFFSNLADVGFHASMMGQFLRYILQSFVLVLFVMPMLAPALGEERLLSIGLLFNCAYMLLYSVAWAFWVPYAAALFNILFVFVQPCMRTIVSKQVGSTEQGKAQGCISGICSFANVVSPLAFSPLTAVFLSERASFDFPGFSIMCIGFASMAAFIQSIMIRATPPIASQRASNCNSVVA